MTEAINHHVHTHHWNYRWGLSALSIFVFLLVLFVGFVTFQSWMDIEPPPVLSTEGQGVGYPYGPNATVVEYKRHIVRAHRIRVTLDRTVNCAGENLTYDLPTAIRERDAGEYTFNGRILLPFHVSPGTHCKLTTLIRYQPFLSVNAHSYYAPDIDFIIVPEGPSPPKGFP